MTFHTKYMGIMVSSEKIKTILVHIYYVYKNIFRNMKPTHMGARRKRGGGAKVCARLLPWKIKKQ